MGLALSYFNAGMESRLNHFIGSPVHPHGCFFLQIRRPLRAWAQAFIPPSTVRFAPVMYADSGPAMNATMAAISSTRP
jgi:hypothetical protein